MTPTEHDRALLDAIRGLAAAPIDDTTFGSTVRALLVPTPAKSAPTVVVRALVPLKVRFPNGTVTNISLPQSLLEEASQHLGGEPAARQLARELALQAPAGVNNRSGWVQDQLTLALRRRPGLADSAPIG